MNERTLFLKKQNQNPFKWRHFQPEIILLCIRWYLRYTLSYRDVKEMMRERGLTIDHTTCIGYLGHPFVTLTTWSFITLLFFFVMWYSTMEIAEKFFIKLEAVNRDDDPAVLLHLLQPLAIFFVLGSRAPERTIRIKERGFPAARCSPQWLKSPEHFSMHFVYALMGSQTELADEQDDIEPEGKANQREPIGLCAAIRYGNERRTRGSGNDSPHEAP